MATPSFLFSFAIYTSPIMKGDDCMQNKELFYDTDEAIKFIFEQTGIDPDIVAKVLDADVEFMRKIGIIED